MNLAETITPKSDQLNADDLIGGPRTIKITEIRSGSAELPVCIHYEGGDGRPYKPGKSMRRVLVAIWGGQSSAYVGRRLTLYRDPAVRFGGEETGGIRISHASDIAEPQTLALTVTRGKRKPYTVQPLPAEAQPRDRATLEAIGNTQAKEGTDALKAWWSALLPKERETAKDLLPAWKNAAAQVTA